MVVSDLRRDSTIGLTGARAPTQEGTWSSPYRWVRARSFRDTPTSRAARPGSPSWPRTGRRGRSTADAATDVAIVGAGIAGVATAFFTLRPTDAGCC